ncbi:ferrous iron transport protein B [Flavobacterium sp. JP2137]|uniref:ferrous iron transport protein B n=1 Tax=Flavobacterium sp. JP2137 TaxID=3414510 RepID=UPI003D2FC7D7
MKSNLKVALIGNPNVGKTSVFNALTGLNQKVGNYPGITVEKKVGSSKLADEITATIIDLPGTYSINPSSVDEQIVSDLLLDKTNTFYPDVAVVVSEVENLKRNLLLFTQIKDLGIPTILVVNMADRMALKGISIDIAVLEQQLKTKIVLISARRKEGISALKQAIIAYKDIDLEPSLNASQIDSAFFSQMQATFPQEPLYKLWLVFTQDLHLADLNRAAIEKAGLAYKESDIKRLQQKEVVRRYQFINEVLKKAYVIDSSKAKDLRGRLDRILTHKVYGYLIFFGILLLIFQAIFEWASVPMDFIDESFSNLSSWLKEVMEPGKLTDLIADGIVPGIGGIMPFVPQIAILFMFIAILEETGYMSRVVFLMDRIMRPFGLSGKSVVPLISGNACAIPAIMSARNIENWKERLLTILVTPFTTCSARLPIYVIIIALVIPDQKLFGFMSLQGLTLGLLYLIGFFAALAAAWVLNKVIKAEAKTYFVVEMPGYKMPILKNVFYTMLEKTKAFVYGAGKIIFVLSIIIWFLGAHGPGVQFENAEEIVAEQYADQHYSEEELGEHIASYQLENSYIGIIGKGIEPVIRPLGYDWKIGIAVLTSFVAREVFVGTLATIYNVGSTEEEETIKNRMAAEVRPNGEKVFDFATGISLLLFYAFAMQCASTVAITKRETNSWKWTMFQLVFMTVFAYVVALIAYQLLK